MLDIGKDNKVSISIDSTKRINLCNVDLRIIKDLRNFEGLLQKDVKVSF